MNLVIPVLLELADREAGEAYRQFADRQKVGQVAAAGESRNGPFIRPKRCRQEFLRQSIGRIALHA